MSTPEPCPACGALPCDQVNSPRTANTPDLRALMERLENCANRPRDYYASTDLCRQAAAALTTLQHRVVEMEVALEPFASFADGNVDEYGWSGHEQCASIHTWFGPTDFRKARSTLKDRGEGR